MEFFKSNTRFAFMGTRKLWYGLSAVLILGSLLSLGIRGLGLLVRCGDFRLRALDALLAGLGLGRV